MRVEKEKHRQNNKGLPLKLVLLEYKLDFQGKGWRGKSGMYDHDLFHESNLFIVLPYIVITHYLTAIGISLIKSVCCTQKFTHCTEVFQLVESVTESPVSLREHASRNTISIIILLSISLCVYGNHLLDFAYICHNVK